ncbi:MAG: protease HtpX [Candidatus Lambdaproteobacteria bacterium]|nr:protease HtpX [Candidatus Lambdaproteobacteria bacterium]
MFAKRIFLFVVVNVLIMATISIVLNVLGVGPYLTRYGINYSALALFCLAWGFGGAFISLALSRLMAKWMMGVEVIDPAVRDPEVRWLVDTVHRYAKAAGLTTMPQVGVYESPDLNAFATGPTRNRSLVAVSTGLMQRMRRDQVEGVLGHELAHIANGDMVTMTLIQGVVNAFVMFIARVIAFGFSQTVREEWRQMAMFLTTIVLEILLSILGSIVVAYFSRWREFRADRGGAALAGRERMIAALQGLKQNLELPAEEEHKSLATLKISGTSGGVMALFATHPDLDVRIAALQTFRPQ